jgi:hypothetical protein
MSTAMTIDHDQPEVREVHSIGEVLAELMAAFPPEAVEARDRRRPEEVHGAKSPAIGSRSNLVIDVGREVLDVLGAHSQIGLLQ